MLLSRLVWLAGRTMGWTRRTMVLRRPDYGLEGGTLINTVVVITYYAVVEL